MNSPRLTFEFVPVRSESRFQPYKGSEDNFQISAARFLDQIGAFWFHPANERKTSPIAGKKLKGKGVKRGVLDTWILDSRQGFVGFVIELKVDGRKPTPEQITWLKELEKRGWKTLITWSLDEFIFEVEAYYGIKTIAQSIKD